MANDTPKWKQLQALYQDGGLANVFVQGLGWSSKKSPIAHLEFEDVTYEICAVGELKGYWVVEVKSKSLPNPRIQSKIDRQLGELLAERILIFTDGKTSHWRWPRASSSGGISYESLSVSSVSLPAFVAQRLVGLAFVAKEFSHGVSLVDVRDRVRGRFDSSNVTKKFFDEFKKRHGSLANNIIGLEEPEQRSSYATLLLNRLMLIYFLQKREFLNDDAFYLENCLASVKQFQGEGKFFSFYRTLLLPLFFERLSSPKRSALPSEIQRIIGEIPYINGGIYEPSELERDLGSELDVPDSEFEAIFQFFGRFNWHLDTRPTGSEDEINPEVIGYIFEQYINLTSGGKKKDGAYYTPEDVTGYMVDLALVPKLLDKLLDAGVPLFDLVADQPKRYLHADLLHGLSPETNQWAQAPDQYQTAWLGDPIHWRVLDRAPHDPALCLPGESWVEMFYRRQRVDSLLANQRLESVNSVNSLVSLNLNTRLLLTDAIDRIDRVDVALEVWQRLVSVRVIDPTCGSGAFLFAAMEALEDAYHHALAVLESFPDARELRGLREEIQSHPNKRYFVRKCIALNNLYGTDIMEDAVQTAELRIFLSLVSCIERKLEIEPLPDLSFNLKSGNLLVGFRDSEDVNRFDGDVLASAALAQFTPELTQGANDYFAFITASSGAGHIETKKLKAQLLAQEEKLRARADSIYLDSVGVAEDEKPYWLARNKPFHWFCEFPQVFLGGGFDVVLGNPPYIRLSDVPAEQRKELEHYRTASTPNLYALCFERSLELLGADGRHAFIVMLNLAFGTGFDPLRRLIRERNYAEWWSSFGNFPSGLFEGADVRNVILGLASGGGVEATRHHIFAADSRKSLFSTIEYFPQEVIESAPPLRAGLAGKVAARVELARFSTHDGLGGELFLKPTGTYWYPVLPVATNSYLINGEIDQGPDPSVRKIVLKSSENRAVALSILGGKIGFLWWSATGDNFHASAQESESPRALAAQAMENDEAELVKLSRETVAHIASAVFLTNHKGLRPNIRWSSLANWTDRFDSRILKALGLSDEWRNLSIWYRQLMRSSGPSAKDKPITIDEAKKLIPLNDF